MGKYLFPFFLLLSTQLSGYTFGKNKYETKDYKWKVRETQHFRIYYYQGEGFLSSFAASVLEGTFSEYTSLFGFTPEDKIPVIIYDSYKDFQETNVIPGLIEEGVGGFTEVLKNRVVVPFSGSYREFRHVLRHELVHVFQYKVIKNNYRNFLYSSILNTIPLWVMEGMAEYFSLGWDTESEAYIRDIALTDKLLSIENLNYYGGYIVYKEGQLIYRYIAEKYGKKACTEFFSTLVYTGNLNKTFEDVFGIEFEKFDNDFQNYVRERFYPVLSTKKLPSNAGKVIVNHERWKNFFNSYPLFSKNGSKIFIMSDKSGRTDVYVISMLGKISKRVIRGESTPDFESIHVLRPGYDISENDSLFTIASQTGNGDALFLIDLTKNKILLKKRFGLDAIYTPVFSKDSRYIAFSGIKDGMEDIYIYDVQRDSLWQITRDFYDDRDPRFMDDSIIIFVSDRNEKEGFYFGRYALFKSSINGKGITRISPYRDIIKEPYIVDGTSSVYFMADDSGSVNIYVTNLKTGTYSKVTDISSMVLNYSVTPDKKLVYATLIKGGYDIVLSTVKTQKVKFLPTGNFYTSTPVEYTTTTKLIPTLSLDYIHGYMTYMSGLGIQGMLYLGLSDELGNRRLDIVTDLSGDISNSNFLISYTYLPKRFDHVWSIYQYTDAFYDYHGNFYFAKQTGASWDVYYPINRFARIESGLAFERYKSDIWLYDYAYTQKESETGYNLMPRIGLVYDNVLYTPYGEPWKGLRFYQGGAKSIPISSSFYDLGVIYSDTRYYIGLGKRASLATRGIIGKSIGKDKYAFYLGGPETLRGYSYDELSGTSALLFNLELRAPFIEYLRLGFPLPITLQDIKCVLFMDAGTTWDDKRPRFFNHDFSLDSLRADLGAGIRINLGLGYLKLDWAWKTNLHTIYNGSQFNISIGNYF